ncbi:H-type lectin domain-containing protein [Curtobacterium flaccumfaciens]|uniref:H-type lectin domain-containing protein n=1 Tax=Curtobacterium flaccumfaciens TaxID=2035 RepID=UPI00188B6E37|nr:H-type lectin domain-containing protein [Curtobacterium flaccumfaciens]MBF4628887.1 H-type lectin domain-containing protein [Curtobacterium flaccumfaciens]
MNGPEKVANLLHDMQTKIDRLGSTSQLGNTTIGGDAAVVVADVVTEAVVTNDALPDVQVDAADGNEGVSDLQSNLAASDEDLVARLADAAADLADAAAELLDAQQDVSDAFDQQVDGLSDDVDTAIKAAGSAKTEAEAASDAARAAAGLAASKGETIVQVSAPTGSRANAANLWIDISTNADGAPKNQPNRYNPDTAKWEPITDAQTVAAAQAAATAAAAAQAAKDVASQANAAAGVAQQTASDANTAALAAAGIANGKGKVIYQASKPTGANAAVGNLWIRSSDNTPWAYDTSSSDWVQVTDKAATDAAAAAAAANQAAVAAANAAKAAQDTANGKPLILFSSTAGPSGTAPTGSIWFLWDTSKNVAGQWLQSGTLAAPVWTPQQIRSEVIANLDVAKLTAGSAAIADLVAQKIAAATGNFQTVNVSNLFVTSGATMAQATIDFLFANVVQAKKITADMLDVNSLNGVTITGAIFKSAASGQRLEIQKTRIDVFDSGNVLRGSILADSATGAIALGPTDAPGLGVFPGRVTSPQVTSERLISKTTTTDVGNVGQLIVNDGAYAEDLPGDVAILDWRANIPLYVAEQLNGSAVSPSRLQAPQLAVYTNTKAPFIVAMQRISDSKVVLVGGDFTSPNGKSVLPLTGSTSYGDSIGAMSSTTITVPFPSGRFASTPMVNANGSNSRVTIGINSVSATSVTFALGNWTSSLVNSLTVYWTATPNPA